MNSTNKDREITKTSETKESLKSLITFTSATLPLQPGVEPTITRFLAQKQLDQTATSPVTSLNGIKRNELTKEDKEDRTEDRKTRNMKWVEWVRKL